MQNLTVFENPAFGTVRTVEVEGEPWLVGKDVAEALGYANPRDALAKHVDPEDKRQDDGVAIYDPMGREQHPTIINESGLYSLVLSSKLPTAKKFRHWVTGEVLPAVRRHGAYLTGPALAEALARPESLYQLLLSFKQEQDARRAAEASCGLLAARVEEAKPKVLFADAVTTSEQSILVGDLAKLLKQNGVETGAKRLFARLREEGYLIRRRGADYNMPTQKAMELGLFEVKETSVVHADGRVTVSKTPKVTGKGQLYFVNRYLNG